MNKVNLARNFLHAEKVKGKKGFMKIFLISDNADTQTGMRLAGIDGILVRTPQEVKETVDKVLQDKEIGILLITEKIAAMQPEHFSRIKIESRTPLIVEIPDRHGSNKEKDYIMSYVGEAIGLKI